MTKETPERPTDVEIWLVESWPINKIEVHYELTGVDTAETCITLTGGKGSRRFEHGVIRDLIDWRVGYNHACEPYERIQKKVAEWKKFEKANAQELAEYERLKKKFD